MYNPIIMVDGKAVVEFVELSTGEIIQIDADDYFADEPLRYPNYNWEVVMGLTVEAANAMREEMDRLDEQEAQRDQHREEAYCEFA